ncbi:trifunctional transcriptional regulator/proline dehydrogenase/L-glutamate gamma-semialdehyde dehydrogenase [Nitrosospira briensis]|uniref:trifunctional transcriptional regulator/proline dehydrogenase/L-glutamate gamma-semialdehyde dehydrogenase n=1 Tax=Nitrosospira briensis TaxID=35799 RepID=UPI0008EAC7DB|nr:trifunctional transcriptional regulator/proline dehydrogenase/L-glutamate gamma-semialdehyde dehydrogenase [Nitrosospira briensis]SFO37484.1 L-proline dehydrogenase /delta-1-pyrroline-5-carboxylate dehydrogenase [Nitrosospira briensis]
MVRNTPLRYEARAPQTPIRAAITNACRRDEAQSVDELVGQIDLPPAGRDQVRERARKLVNAVRRKRARWGGTDSLLHEFSLSSQEGIALMCLAEALLRIPDRETADRLIRDKIGKGDWRTHLGHSSSLFVNAAAWGLLLGSKLVSTHSESRLTSALTSVVEKGGEPLIRKGVDVAMRMLGHQFVIGETIARALDRSREQEALGYRYSYDMLGEGALTASDAERYHASYEAAIHAIGRASAGRGIYAGPGISVKLSALHPRYERGQRDRVFAELLPRLKSLLLLARHYDVGLNIDAEEADRLELSIDLLDALAFDPALAGWNGIGFVVQAYQKRCPFVIDWIIDLSRRSRHRIMVRLVKGAYWDAEIKRAQVEGLDSYPVYTRKVHTDVCYLACAQRLLHAPDAVYPQFATHNAQTLSAVYQMAADAGMDDYEFQCLHGMGETLYDQVIGSDQLGKPCRIYAPVGSHETLLSYLVRRLLENGANSSFVNQIVDKAVSVEELIVDPITRVQHEGSRPHPAIPAPRDIYGERMNSSGVDFSDEHALAALSDELAALNGREWLAAPILASGERNEGERTPVLNPADRTDHIGAAIEASEADVEEALAAAHAFASEWQTVPKTVRATLLEQAADALEANRAVLIGLAVREAGKSLPNAVAEVREAVDFCRYYAQQMRSQFPAGAQPEALGPIVCISPWNFPLAIFIGEVSAALAAGNPVLAKPAEQTPLIAAVAVRLMHEAGIPHAALQLLPGCGETVGVRLINDSRVRGVIFTGSTEVAQHIHVTLAKRSQDEEIPLIAETGGQNAMVVDSSARIEQVVQDVLVSAFDSAGQRCSSLRVLCLQEDIADRVLKMLKGAMRELALGDPGRLSTDVGPVIDAEAQRALLAHINEMRASGHSVFQLPLPPVCANGTFVPPTLIEIGDIGELEREVFGPVLHVVRFARGQLDELVGRINATGYGLTLGIHSRIDETIDFITARAHVGNIYVNRSMIGAVVGVQPFGGEGKSGTGPKAGGPLYLHRLLRRAPLSFPGIGGEHLPDEQDALAPLQTLTGWAQQMNRRMLAELCMEYAMSTPLRYRVPLPGPTGESNTLVFAPRGMIACIADDEATLLEQIAAVLATGNQALLSGGSVSRALPDMLPPALSRQLRIEPDLIHAPIAIALYAGPVENAYLLRNELAARDGARVPLITARGKGFPLYRLVAERVVSVNTTAAGGNASLMTLGI